MAARRQADKVGRSNVALVKLDAEVALGRLGQHDHGVLSTLNADRGVDAVPVVYAVEDRTVGIPIDTIKAKTSTRLQRVRNLAIDPRATLLADHWDRDDWSRLWWVRAGLRWNNNPDARQLEALAESLVQRYSQYESRPFADVLVFEITSITGWAA